MNQSILQNRERQADDIKRLVVLPFTKSVEISYKSLKVRFFRSLITALSLMLAVSFLSFANVSTDLINGLLSTGNPEYRQDLIRSGYDLEENQDQVGNSPKQKWIVILSLLVCVVGIVNAQLMAVTERFREIGTMKCLGALDRFILRLFLLEAAMQGLAGSLAGAVFGCIFALLNGWIQFGTVAISAIAWNEVLMSVLISATVGTTLSLLGVLYPAFLAARMQPVEAMRVEQ